VRFLRWLRSLFFRERRYAPPPRPPDRIHPKDRTLPFMF
jgi:hypothetical protein